MTIISSANLASQSSKSIGLRNTPNIITKGRSENFSPALKLIFNLSLLKETFPSAVVSVFEKSYTRLWLSTALFLFKKISKISENIIMITTPFFKFKIISSLHTFVELKLTVIKFN
jgi:hypothetical protein